MSNDSRRATSYSAIVGRMLEHERVGLRWSQAEVADRIGLSQAAWSRIESGSTSISVDQLWSIADLFQTTPATILELADRAEQELRAQDVDILPPREGTAGVAMITGAALGALLAVLLLRK